MGNSIGALRFSPTSLRKRLVFFVLIPVVVLLTGMGFSGFWYARNTLLTEWGDAAILRLQRAAHNVDMRLEAPKKWVEMLHANPGQPELRLLQDMIISRLAGMDGVMDVNLSTPEAGNIKSQPSRFPDHGAGMIRSNSTAHGSGHGSPTGLVNVSPPQYHAESQSDAVTLVSNLIDSTGQPVGRLDVIIRFDYVIETVKSSGWWQSHKAFLVDESGRILAATNPVKQQVLGDTGDDLELRVLKSIGETSYGIVFGNGFPVSEICGFYRLAEAPWYLVTFAPGRPFHRTRIAAQHTPNLPVFKKPECVPAAQGAAGLFRNGFFTKKGLAQRHGHLPVGFVEKDLSGECTEHEPGLFDIGFQKCQKTLNIQKGSAFLARNTGDTDADRRFAPQAVDMGGKGQSPVLKQLQHRAGPQKIGGRGHNDGIGFQNRVQNFIQVIVDHAALFVKQTPVTGFAWLDVKILKPDKLHVMGFRHMAGHFLDHEFAVAQFSGRGNDAEDMFHSITCLNHRLCRFKIFTWI